MSDEKLFIKIMKVMADADMCNDVFWDCSLSVHVNCNDVFGWGCADAETIENEEDLAIFVQAAKDSEAYCDALYCARKRGMRPQGAYIKLAPDDIKNLFKDCGPERRIDILNPQDTDGKYLYKTG